ncbi:MAG: hypothetical protein ACRBN8_27515 [Nannocystales bacterium]
MAPRRRLTLLFLFCSLGCDDLGRSEETLDALRIARDVAKDDDAALLEIVTACAGGFAKATVGDDGRSVSVATSVTGWGQGGSADSFLAATRRELGKRALCIHVAGRERNLQTVRFKHTLAESNTVLYELTSSVAALDRDVKDWSKAQFGGGPDKKHALHDAVFESFEVHSKNEALQAFEVQAP